MNPRRFLPLFSCAAALLLAACASSSGDAPAAAGPASASAVPSVPAPNANWIVSDVYDPGQLGYQMIGQVVRLTDNLAEDALGRTCLSPSYRPLSTTSAEALGRADDVSWNRPVKGFDIWCGAIPFGSYVMARDGSYLSRQGDAVLRFGLYKGDEGAPPPALSMNPIIDSLDWAQQHGGPARLVHSASSAVAAPAPVAAASSPANAHPVYLASYDTHKRAEQHWEKMQKSFPSLAGLTADYADIDLGKKGKFVRLYAVTSDTTAALCQPLLKNGYADCGAVWGRKP